MHCPQGMSFKEYLGQEALPCSVQEYATRVSKDDARKLFNTLFQKDVVIWMAMVTKYGHEEMCEELQANYLFIEMQVEGRRPGSPKPVTFAGFLQACVTATSLLRGYNFHA